MKAQPKAAAKAKKPAAKAKPAAKPAAKPVAKKPAAKAAKPVAKAPAKKAAPVKTTKPAAKAAVKAPAPPAARKAAPAPAKTEKPAAKAVPAPVKTTPPAKASDAAVKAAPPAKASSPIAPAAARPVSATTRPGPASAATVAAFGTVKATYTPMANQSVLNPPPVVAVKKDPKLANNWKTKSAEELSDAEVLAMPDTEYMNDKQMSFFRIKLQQLKTEILNSAGETTEHLREDTVIVPDPADRATIEEEHALELRTRDRERKLLKKIEQSIARIDAGDYGYCDETGEPIGVGRLLARPTATLSLEAQQRRELKQKMFGD
ncbi:RNA polymerase-binding protein DksA [Caenimonas sedimenti]|uniref:RNA polymerase-binding protein DksA n=1 Tax=Caenimonas sedimenti TaxID=2596921 RepID=UPI002103F838|nr:RNA polymerase-binding protein DksA [Caenimonas sedimenti]